MYDTILVVDDNSKNLRLLKDILEDENFTVFTANNGLPVLKMTHDIKPDIILLDVMMPGMDGFEVCKLLKGDYEIKNIPVIMVTAKTESADLKKALEIGAFDYIKKPIDEMEVIARIKSALRFKQYQDKLNEMASKDGLTGVFNHALLIELFEKELSKRERNCGDIAFVMLDIDFFKKVNDTYGHISGDMVLKELSGILTASTRSSDIVGRYGGEEFGIVLPEITAENAYQLCERIRQSVENHDFSTGKDIIKITISMGIFFKGTINSQSMIKKADEALYKAKQNGRNRVEVFVSE
jgi:diguanylate cyclase (GGDEF)-like protein